MIIAIPVQERCLFTPMGGTAVNPPPPYWGVVTWWHWWCSTCGNESRPRAMFSHASGALDRGAYHEQKYGCRPDGQQSLFA
jgi:hypothetical protein